MAVRKQQEVELQAAIHGIPIKKQKIFHHGKSSTADLNRQLQEGIAKGLPIKIIKRKK